MKNLIAAGPFGEVSPPPGIGRFDTIEQGALGNFLQLVVNGLVILAGVFALINLILAGYAFMSAGDDPQKVTDAWGKIWKPLLGLSFAAGAFVIAAIIGRLLFGSYDALLKPVIPTL